MILLLFLLGSFWLVCLHHFVFIALGKSHEETGNQGLLKCVSHLHRQALKLGKLGGCTLLDYKRLILFAEEEKLLMGQKDQFLCSPVTLLKICVGYNFTPHNLSYPF